MTLVVPKRRRAAVAGALLALAAVPAAAQMAETLLLQLSLESELLEDAFRRYRRARDAERNALNELTELSDRLDGMLRDPIRPVGELRRMEDQLVAAGEIASARIRRTANVRLELYDRRQRLAILERRLAEAGGGPLVPEPGISGLWQIEVGPGGAFGLLRLQADGTLVTGTYVLSDGGQGSIRGTVVDRGVRLERIDSELGFIATLEGELDPARGQIEGSWTGTELAVGEPTTGNWTARRLARGLRVEPSG